MEDLVDVLLETSAQDLVGLVQAEHGQVVGLEEALAHHVQHPAWGAHDDMGLVSERLLLSTDVGTTGGAVNDALEMLAKGLDDTLDLLGELPGWGEDEGLGLLDTGIDVLQDADGESTRFTGTGLSLSEGVSSLDDGKNALLLDLRGLLVTVTEDSSEKIGGQAKLLEGIDLFRPVGLDVLAGNHLGLLFFLLLTAFFLFDLFHGLVHLLGHFLSLSGYILILNV